jgi:hypothetical protein
MRRLTTIVAKPKLPKVFRQMLTVDLNVSCVNRVFLPQPETFNAVYRRAILGNLLIRLEPDLGQTHPILSGPGHKFATLTRPTVLWQ